jgi:hypothetical protein
MTREGRLHRAGGGPGCDLEPGSLTVHLTSLDQVAAMARLVQMSPCTSCMAPDDYIELFGDGEAGSAASSAI